MKVSRRNFLTTAIGAAATMISIRSSGLDQPGVLDTREPDCALMDLNSSGALPESFDGFEKALRQGGINFVKTGPDTVGRFRMVIVPGFGVVDPAVAQALSDVVNGGAYVLLESGAGFLSPSDFFASQDLIHRHFNLALESPVDLWSGRSADAALVCYSGRRSDVKRDSHGPIPYVSYVWPHAMIVRDFSRVIPVSAQMQEVIGRVGDLPVGLKKRLGKGTVIFLGSPIGPALGAGDPEASRWLRLCIAKTGSVSNG
jgi:hypothetical protein